MSWFWNFGRGKSYTEQKPLPKEPAPPADPLFLEHRSKDTGIILSAEIAYGKSSGRRYIRAVVDFGGTEDVITTIGRVTYTLFVVRRGLATHWSAEAENIALMVGEPVKVRWDHTKSIDDQIYVIAYPLEVGDTK